MKLFASRWALPLPYYNDNARIGGRRDTAMASLWKNSSWSQSIRGQDRGAVHRRLMIAVRRLSE